MYKSIITVVLALITLLTMRAWLNQGRLDIEPLVIRTVAKERSEASTSTEAYPLELIRNDKHLFYRLTSSLAQGRVDIALYDCDGNYLFTQGAAGGFTSYFPLPEDRGRFDFGQPFKIEVLEKNIIGRYKFEVSQLPSVSPEKKIKSYFLFAAFVTSGLTLLVFQWWVIDNRANRLSKTA